MRVRHRIMQTALAGVMGLAAAGPAAADREARNTVIGLGVGALAGAVLSEGDPWVTAGTAVAGGVLGNVLTDDDRDRKRRGSAHHHKHKHKYKHRGNGHHKARYRHRDD